MTAPKAPKMEFIVPRRIFSDEELTAYLDNEANESLRTAIDNALDDPDQEAILKERLDGLSILTDGLKMAYDARLFTAPPIPAKQLKKLRSFSAHKKSSENSWRIWAASGALAASAAFGLFIGSQSWLNNIYQPRNEWIQKIAEHQESLSEQILSAVLHSRKEQSSRLNSLSQIFEYDLSYTMNQVGLEFIWGREIKIENQSVIQLDYRSLDDSIIRLYLMKADSNKTKPPRFFILGEENAAYWQSDNIVYLLVGNNDQDLANKIRDHFSHSRDDNNALPLYREEGYRIQNAI